MQVMPKRVDTSSKQKALILEKAGKLFWDRGYDNTSIRHIARECGFEASNIYYYFSNKEHILFELIWQEINQLVQSIKHLNADKNHSPADDLRELIKIHVDLTLRNRQSSLRLLPDAELKRLAPRHKTSIIKARDAYDQILRKIIRSGIDKGEFAQMDEKLAGFAIASAIVRSRIWFSNYGKYSVSEIADFIFNFVTYGLTRFKTNVNKQTISGSTQSGLAKRQDRKKR